MDATLHAAFSAAGLADTVVHTPQPGGSPITRRGYVDRAVATLGGEAQVRWAGGVVTLLRADGVDPRPGDLLVVGSDSYTVDRVEVDDESRIACTVTRG